MKFKFYMELWENFTKNSNVYIVKGQNIIIIYLLHINELW